MLISDRKRRISSTNCINFFCQFTTRSDCIMGENHSCCATQSIAKRQVFGIVKSWFFFNVSTVGLNRFDAQIKGICES